MRNCSVGNKLLYTKEVAKRIRKLPVAERKRLGTQLQKLSDNSDLGKKLTGPLTGLHSLRAGRYRVIYRRSAAKKTVLILTLGHRKDIYKKTRRKRKQ